MLAETKDEPALRRVAVRFARRMDAEDDLYTPRPGADEPFVQLLWSRGGLQDDLFNDFWIEVQNGRISVETGQSTGGVAGQLPDTPHWKDAVRRLGGEPTLLIDILDAERALRGSFGPLTYVAARATGDGSLRAVLVWGRP